MLSLAGDLWTQDWTAGLMGLTRIDHVLTTVRLDLNIA